MRVKAICGLLAALSALFMASGASAVHVAGPDERSFRVAIGDVVELSINTSLWEVKSQYPTIVSVDENGKATAKAVGNCEVYATQDRVKRTYTFSVYGENLPEYTVDEAFEAIRAALSRYETSVSYTMKMLYRPTNRKDWSELLNKLSYQNIDGIDRAYISGGTISTAKGSPTDPTIVAVTQAFSYRTGGDVARSYAQGADGAELTGKALELRQKCDAIIDELGLLNKSMTDRQKAEAVHDYIALNCAYDSKGKGGKNSDSYDAYGALVLGRATCQGYSEAAKLLLNAAGVECVCVTGKGPGNTSHGWNSVRLDDGKWYSMDISADDPTPDIKGRVKRDFMLVSEEFLRKSGYVW